MGMWEAAEEAKDLARRRRPGWESEELEEEEDEEEEDELDEESDSGR